MKPYRLFSRLIRCTRGAQTGALALGLALAGFTASAQMKPTHRPDVPNFDKRSATAGQQASFAGQEQGRASLAAKLPGVVVDVDPLLQSPKFIRVTDGFLSGPGGQGRAVSAKAAAAFANDPHGPIKAFLKEHSALFGHDATVLNDAHIKRDYVDAHNGLRTVVWEQQLEGIPVFEASLMGHITKKGELTSLSSLFVPAPAAAADAGTPGRAALVQNPPVSVRDAFAAGARNLGFELAPSAVVESQNAAQNEGGYRVFKLPSAAYARLVWLPLNRTSLRLAWDVILSNPATKERFQEVVDAQTGEVYLRHALTWYLSNATFNVYTSDSPSPFSPGLQVPGTFQPPYTNRIMVTWAALDTNASPLGWIDDTNNTTTGNNADAFVDRNFDQQPDQPRPVGNPNRTFDFPLDLTQDPTNYIDASTTELFYKCNWYHDRLYQLGFTEAAGNFQDQNFGRGGLGNDHIINYVQSGADVGITDNSMFGTMPDGISGECFMFVFDFPNPWRDGSLDSDVMLHEFTHGTSTRLVGGGMALNNVQSGGMGEGWSDFYALSLLSETNDDPHACYASGGYVTYQFAGLQENYYFGIRHFPYSTDMAKNPFTFKDIDPGQISPHAGVPRSPIYPFDAREADEVHHQGEVWCSMLWEVRANLVDKYGWGIGNELMLQLVTDGMKLTPPNPNFIEARDAIFLADLNDTGGANSIEIWKGFAKRGLGVSARSPNGDTTIGVVEAFDLIGLQVNSTFVLGGNGNGVIDTDECNDLYISLINNGSAGATNVQVSVTTTTPRVYVMQQTANYPNIPSGGIATNLTAFKLSTGPTFVCGTPINLKLTIKSDTDTQLVDLQLQTGTNGVPVRWNNFFPIAIPDNFAQGTNSIILVTNITGAVQNIAVSLYTIHPFDSDLKFELIGPDGTRVVLSDRNGGAGQNYGLACFPDTSRTTFDDNATNRIVNGRTPFLGAFKPEQPLAAFAGKSGTNINGAWQLHVIDNAAFGVGSLQCWSLFVQTAACEPGGGQCPGVDLAITMTANPDPAVVGSNLVYSLVVTNNGPGTAFGTVVSHNLPAGALFISATSSQGTCSQSGGIVTATLGNMAAGDSATIDVTVIPTVAGSAFSSASVASTEPELNPLNNSVAVRTLVAPPSSDLAVGLVGFPNPTVVGGQLIYTVAVTNKGPATASGIVVTNTLPSTLKIGAVDSTQGSVVPAGNVVLFNVGLLPRNGTATATISTIPQAYGVITATARASAVQPDPVQGNNTATATTTVGQASDLALSMTALPNPAVLGSNVTFTITATNLGPNVATNVTVTESLPVGASVASVSLSQGTYSISGGSLICNLGTIIVGGSANVRVVVVSTRVGTLTSSATITSSQSDPNSANNSAVASAQVAPPFINIAAAGATLTAENFFPTNGYIEPGETVTIQFRLQNLGNVPNTNLIATLLPTGGVTAPGPAQSYGVIRPIGVPGGAPVQRPFSFTAGAPPSGIITATLQLQDASSNLPPVNFTFVLPQVYRFSNTNPIVIPTVGIADPYPSQISVSGITNQLGKLTATLTQFSHDYPHDVSALLVGPSGVKTLLMSHAGDLLPTYNVDLTFDDTADLKLPATGNLAQGRWKPSDYPPGVTFTNPAPAGPYSSLLSDFNGEAANGTWSLYIMDDNTGDGGVVAGGWSLEFTAVTPVNQLADIGVSVTASPDPVLVGNNLTYTWTVTNAGPATASGVSLTDTLPGFISFVSATISQGNWTTNGNVLEANFASLAPGGSATLTALVQPQVGSPALITNSAIVAAFENDLRSGNNRVTVVSAARLPLVGLTLGMNASPNPVIVGSNLVYTVGVTNNGPGNALNVSFTDVLPVAAAFAGATVSQGTVGVSSGVLTANLGTLLPGANATLQLSLVPLAAGSLTNAVTVSTASSDAVPGTSISTVVTVNDPAAHIVAEGAILVAESSLPANGTVDPGETVTVSFGLSNKGVLDAADLNATLLPTGGVTSPSASVNYGTVPRSGQIVWRSFTFTAAPNASGSVVATLQLADGTKPLGTAAFTFPLPVTTSVSSSGSILIPDHGNAIPYPSSINISGLTGVVSKVTVSLNQLSHSFPSDVTVVLASPGRPSVLLMSHNGASLGVTNITLTFDDAAAGQLPVNARMTTGAYRPSRYGNPVLMPPPAPLAPYSSTLSALQGLNPNGAWTLFVYDDSVGDEGGISGWTLNLTTVTPVNPVADLAVTATAPGVALLGNPLTYTFSVTNSGPEGVLSVTLSDTLPAGVAVVSNSVSQGTGRVQGSGFVFDLGSLAAGGSATATLTVLPSLPGTLLNTAALSGGFTDFAAGDNSVQSSTIVFNAEPPVLSARISAGLLELTVTGQPNARYVVEWSSGLATWSALSTNTAAADGTLRYTDPEPPVGARFYRAVRQLP